jgi:hypothetical protein
MRPDAPVMRHFILRVAHDVAKMRHLLIGGRTPPASSDRMLIRLILASIACALPAFRPNGLSRSGFFKRHSLSVHVAFRKAGGLPPATWRQNARATSGAKMRHVTDFGF